MSVTNLVTSHRNGFAHSSNQEVVQALVTEVKAHYPTTSTRVDNYQLASDIIFNLCRGC